MDVKRPVPQGGNSSGLTGWGRKGRGDEGAEVRGGVGEILEENGRCRNEVDEQREDSSKDDSQVSGWCGWVTGGVRWVREHWVASRFVGEKS